MDPLRQVKKLREEYERSLDAAESHRVAYHGAVLDLYLSGTPLREIATELGLSHQRVHQIVSSAPPRHGNLGRAAGGIAGALVLIAATFGALRIAHAQPFAHTAAAPPAITQKAKTTTTGVKVAIDPRTGAVLRFSTKQPLRPSKSVTTVLIDPTSGATIRTH
jgi:hypothetical protein